VKAPRGSPTLPLRAGRVLLTLFVIAALAPAASASFALADTKSDLAAAKARLVALEERIAAQARQLTTLHARINALAARVAAATARHQETLNAIAGVQEDLRLTRLRFEELRGQLDARAAASYRDGVGTLLEIVLGATSYADFTDRIAYAGSMSRADASLSQEVQRTATELSRKQETLSAIQASQEAALKRLEAERTLMDQALADERKELADLSGVRAEAASLVQSVGKALRAEEVAAAKVALHGGTPIPFGDWASLFLPRLGAPTCRNNMVLVVAWAATEYTQARFNPLATSYSMPGSTIFAGAVKNYVSLDQGITATVLTLESTNPAFNYAPIVADLRACADPMVTAEAINHSAYCACSGSYPLTYLVPFVESNYDFYAKICTGC
jgi:peptidoglycan hydrolase CwlO-like protein